ncbi:MAG: lysophospholipid acyltransferase family protein [Bacteroidales bacterium]
MDTKVINKSEVKKALKVKGFIGEAVAALAMWIAGFNRMNQIYSHIAQYHGVEFATKLIEHLNIKCDVIPDELEYLPKNEPFIIVSNHPFGAIDGMIMLSKIGAVRPDFKILTNFILSHIPNLEEHFFPVNPFSDKPGLRSSLKGLKLAKEHLTNGGVLGLFPAGEVSSNCNKEKIVKDIDWQHSVIKLITATGVPVVPIYFDGGNSKFFHLIGKINPMLRTVRLPHELANKKDKTISMRIGRPILSSEIEEFTTKEDLGRYLWNRTYALEANVDDTPVGGAEKENMKEEKKACGEEGYTVPLAKQVDKKIMAAEIESVCNDKLFELGTYSCYLADVKNIPNVMQEIGRCREEAFRAVGEGTNNAIDTDKYDNYYKHLVLWDHSQKAIVGAYRLGFGGEIIPNLGLDGMYTNSLFRYKQEFRWHLLKSIELGRSFVSLEYQRETLPLMLLIKGLLYTVIKYPQIKYLIGPVSISAWYPLFYRSLMVYYLQKRQSIPEFSRYVSPKNPFVPDYKRVDIATLLAHRLDSLEKFDRFMYRLSNNRFRLPTLLKKYIKINARVVAFNVDPNFNYCVDGLIMLNLTEVPKSEIDSLSKEFEDRDMVYRRFDIALDITE